MSICPSGHETETNDYCDVCGAPLTRPGEEPIESNSVSAKVAARGSQRSAGGRSVAPGTALFEQCPDCGTTRTGRFCEVDGYDFEASPEAAAAVAAASGPSGSTGPGGTGDLSRPDVRAELARSVAANGDPQAATVTAPPGTWRAVIRVDPAWFEVVRRRNGPDIDSLALPGVGERLVPLVGGQLRIGRGRSAEIDLGAPPADPGVSGSHALLLRQPDDTWAVLDLNSTNCTYLNESEDPIDPYVPVPLSPGDQVHVGAWTTITLTEPAD
jgi:hypothetical protein